MLTDPQAIEYIDETFRVLNKPLQDISLTQKVPIELTAALEQNTFIFSGFKSHNALEEVSQLLIGKDGGFKPFKDFLKDVEKIDKVYNKNYLQAEYNMAVQSVQMAVKWKEFIKTGEKYDLQYRTAFDERVREEHRPLHAVTLPITDPFWRKYFPPNGWGCRCTVVQVRKGKYAVSNPDEAMKAGDAATEKPKQQIFRFNPGAEEKIFPKKHPYFKGAQETDCTDCSVKLSYRKSNVTCQICKIYSDKKKDIKGLIDAANKATGKEKYKILEEITKLNGFTEIFKSKGLSVQYYGELPEVLSTELKAQISAAKKALKLGFSSYLLPNPRGIVSADLILVKNKKYVLYELKTILGKNSVGNRLFDSTLQSENVMLNIKSKISVRFVYESILEYFNKFKLAKEVLIFKGNKEFVITKSKIKQKDFLYYLIKEWEK